MNVKGVCRWTRWRAGSFCVAVMSDSFTFIRVHLCQIFFATLAYRLLGLTSGNDDYTAASLGLCSGSHASTRGIDLPSTGTTGMPATTSSSKQFMLTP